MSRVLTVAGAVGVGSGLMYFLDPDRGRRRRAMVRDKTVSAVKSLDDAVAKTACDLSNRARGLVSEARSAITGEHVDDQVIEARVLSKIGRVVSHPSAIEVSADQGHVALSGPVLAREMEDLISCVRSVRGVTGVENQLSVHKTARDIPALQGGSARGGSRSELMQANWSPAARLIMGVAGSALAYQGMKHRHAFWRAAGLMGVGILARGLTNMKLKRLAGLVDGRRRD